MKVFWAIVAVTLAFFSGCASKNTNNSNIIPAPYRYSHPTWGKYRHTSSKQNKDFNKEKTLQDEYYKGVYSKKNF